MPGIQVMLIAVADMAAERVDDRFMVAGVKRITENQVFLWAVFLKNMSAAVFGLKKQFRIIGGYCLLLGFQLFLKRNQRELCLDYLTDLPYPFFFF